MSDKYITEEYFQYHKKYNEMYSKALILYQVGAFYELYSTETEGPNLQEVSNLTNIIITRKNKKKLGKPDYKNPNVLGFPINSLIKYLEILVSDNYVVIIIDQISGKKNGNKETREITNIYSKGTYIENLEKKEGNYIVTIYVSNDIQKNGEKLCSIGATAVDVSTGTVIVHEAYSTKYDEVLALDEADRFITNLSPKEIIIYNSENKDFVINYLKLEDYRYYENIDPKYFKLKFQNELLSKIYSNSLVSPIEQLDLDKNIYAIVSLVLTFDFIYDKNKNLLNNLKKPIKFMNNKHLLLGNNAIRQLDIIENCNNNTKTKYKSLFHVVNCTSTALGERFLKLRLLSPLINIDELNSIYDMTELFIKDDLYLEIEQYLNNIRDIERLQRKMELQIMKPFELPILLSSYENIFELITSIKNKKLEKIYPNDKDDIKKFIKYIKNIFNIDELVKYSNFEIETSIFNEGLYKDIDELKDNVESVTDFMEKIRKSLNNLLLPSKLKIYMKRNDRDGYYLCMTNKSAELLKSKFNKPIIIDKTKISLSSLDIRVVGKNTKIFFPSINTSSDSLVKFKEQMIILNKKYFFKELTNIYNKFSKIFKQCNKFISYIDFIKSSAKISKLYNYVRPKLVEGSSYVKAQKLRHPIIERIIDYEYIPHDVDLGMKLKGMIVYGLNASGKSVFMKSIGLSVIMSQSGLFVPAESFELCPYKSLYTRITGEDNIFRGLSSFALEMVELNAILKRANENTLIIGDEVCRGTEHISGNALVASTILKLTECKSSFIFASHLHEIMELEEIKKLTNVKAFHLSVKYKDKKLIYDRQLKEGVGERVYGITVAQYIIQDKEFIDMAMNIKNKILDINDSLIVGKTSKYNKKIYVNECYLCGKTKNLETHHINFQKDCEDGFVKDKKHIKKNQESNLIVLCDKCHDEIHNNKIKLIGYFMTSEGKEILKN